RLRERGRAGCNSSGSPETGFSEEGNRKESVRVKREEEEENAVRSRAIIIATSLLMLSSLPLWAQGMRGRMMNAINKDVAIMIARLRTAFASLMLSSLPLWAQGMRGPMMNGESMGMSAGQKLPGLEFVGIEQHLNAEVPPDLAFRDEFGN